MGDPGGGQGRTELPRGLVRHGEEEVLGRQVFVVEPFRLGPGGVENGLKVAGHHTTRIDARHLGLGIEDGLGLLHEPGRIRPDFLQDGRGNPLLLFKHGD